MQTAALGADLAFLAGRPVTREQCEAITNGSDKSHESKEVLECDERLASQEWIHIPLVEAVKNFLQKLCHKTLTY
ncbi:hypothetical protein Anapl_11850 [Anas platyrhynchos]|uniref:Uncharacterized protein n=1 Tax=Anas platyrhynchos TaxID=8839 RepID=R0KZ60_ANAPL|nr:hypothetical protein Anapl_11850 [Anas platyrhynchos]